jgi:deoxyribodipyrimidine photolyase-related protein
MSGDTKTKKYVQDAIKYVKAHPAFQEHVGEVEDLKNVCIYPHTREEAFARLRGFIKERFENYGTYQDAISQDEPFLFHSIISAPLNIGILTPRDVLDEVMAVKDKVPMNSLEGFVRQLIGWREYCNYVYSYYYDEIVDADHFDATNEDISSWYTATTGVEPLDNEIQKAKKYAFSHHIVRLMIFLNMFVLTETKINVIYKWFMEVVSIDAYDWVMRSNIAMMSHYWTKGMRKPYISGANYVLKMSDYKKGEWCNVWTERFHTFLKKKKDKLVGSASIYLRNIPRE